MAVTGDQHRLLAREEQQWTGDRDKDHGAVGFSLRSCRGWLQRRKLLLTPMGWQLLSTMATYIREQKVVCCLLLVVTWMCFFAGSPDIEDQQSLRGLHNVTSHVQQLASREQQLRRLVQELASRGQQQENLGQQLASRERQLRSVVQQLFNRTDQLTAPTDPHNDLSRTHNNSTNVINCVDNKTISAFKADVENLKHYNDKDLEPKMKTFARDAATEFCHDCVRMNSWQSQNSAIEDVRRSIGNQEERINALHHNDESKLKIEDLETKIKYCCIGIAILGVALMLLSICVLCCCPRRNK